MAKKKFYSIQAKAAGNDKVVEIRIYDEIGFWGVTAKTFVDELDLIAVDANRILVSINSPGGDVFDALAIYNALLRHNLPVTTRVDGVAASAASLIFMAGSERLMPENAVLMVHNAWIITSGTAEELRNTANMMDDVRNGIVSAYRRSGQDESKIIELMDATTWMDALDAQAMGFCTAIEDPVKMSASANVLEVLAKHQQAVPESLIAACSDGDEPSNSTPDPAQTPSPDTIPAPTPEPESAPEVAPNDLVAKVYADCQSKGIPQLSQAVLLSGAMTGLTAATERIQAAEQIATLCASVKLADKAAEFVQAGLSVEQVRARLFDHVVQSADSIDISNLQQSKSNRAPSNQQPVTPKLSATEIYAFRRSTT